MDKKSVNRKVDVAIIGAGTAGLNAMGQARRYGKSFVLINGGELGTTCARVGCMPSKALIQVADQLHGKTLFDRFGIEGGDHLVVNSEDAMEHVRDVRDLLVDRVLDGSTDALDDEQFIEGYAKFIDKNHLSVNDETIEAGSIVIANGSRPVVPAAWAEFQEKVVTTDDFFELEELPESIAVIGLGVIGLELGQALSRLGVVVAGFDAMNSIAGLTDEAVNKVAIDVIGKDFPLYLGAAAEVSLEGDKLRVTAGEQSILVDKVLASLGRQPNIDNLDLANLGLALDDRGVPKYNSSTMQIGDTRLFIAGDTSADLAISHEAAEEGRIAGLNACRDEVLAFKRKTPFGITFCDPNIVTVGMRWAELRDDDSVVVGEMPMGQVGRALIMGKNKGLIRLYARKSDGLLLGASMMAVKGENLAHLLAWSIQQEMTVHQMLQMPYYHPVIEEAVQATLQRILPELDAKIDLPVDLRPL